jgi:hypothetical protein
MDTPRAALDGPLDEQTKRWPEKINQGRKDGFILIEIRGDVAQSHGLGNYCFV